MDAFKIIRYISKAMLLYGVEANSISHDTPERVLKIAKRCLESDSEGMIFVKTGDRWGASIRRNKEE